MSILTNSNFWIFTEFYHLTMKVRRVLRRTFKIFMVKNFYINFNFIMFLRDDWVWVPG